LAMARRQIVEYHDLVTVPAQVTHHVRTDVTRAAANQNLQSILSSMAEPIPPRKYIITATPSTARTARLEWSFDSISVRAGNNARQTSEGTSMKILVGYKRVVDYNVRVQVRPDGSGVVTDGVKLSANPFDEIALEEALRLREAGVADEVVVAGIGPDDLTAHLRNGLAMGADRAIHVSTDAAIQPLTAARTFLKLIEAEEPGLVILGKQAIDDDSNQTGQMLAALWDRPQATFASELKIDGDK